MDDELFQFQMPKFSKKNYENWCIRMKAILGANDAWDVVENGFVVPETEAVLAQSQKENLRSQKEKDNKATMIIHQCLDDDMLHKVAAATTSKQVWDILKISARSVDKVQEEIDVEATVPMITELEEAKGRHIAAVVQKDAVEPETKLQKLRSKIAKVNSNYGPATVKDKEKSDLVVVSNEGAVNSQDTKLSQIDPVEILNMGKDAVPYKSGCYDAVSADLNKTDDVLEMVLDCMSSKMENKTNTPSRSLEGEESLILSENHECVMKGQDRVEEELRHVSGNFEGVTKGEKWEHPEDVIAVFESQLEDGPVVLKFEGHAFPVEDGDFFLVISKAVQTMKNGEKAYLLVTPQYRFGKSYKPALGAESVLESIAPPGCFGHCVDESTLICVTVGESMVSMHVLESDSIASMQLQIQTCKLFVVSNCKQKLVHGGRESFNALTKWWKDSLASENVDSVKISNYLGSLEQLRSHARSKPKVKLKSMQSNDEIDDVLTKPLNSTVSTKFRTLFGIVKIKGASLYLDAFHLFNV